MKIQMWYKDYMLLSEINIFAKQNMCKYLKEA